MGKGKAADATAFWERDESFKAKDAYIIEKANIPKSSFSSLKGEKRFPPLDKAFLIASALGTTLEYLVTGIGPDQKITKYENGQMKNDYMVKDIRGEYVPIDGEITFIPIHSQKVAAGAGQVLLEGDFYIPCGAFSVSFIGFLIQHVSIDTVDLPGFDTYMYRFPTQFKIILYKTIKRC